MMYMPDCLDAAISIMKADTSSIKRRDGYNLNAMSFSAEELTKEIAKHVPGLEVSYVPDFRQGIADSWPMSLDDTEARRDWSWSPKWDLQRMTKDMLERLKGRAPRS